MSPVLLRKPGWGGWGLGRHFGPRWSCEYSSIVVTMTHGIVEDEAEDWRFAVLAGCDAVASKLGTAGLRRYRVDDIDREWLVASIHEVIDWNLFDPYRLNAPV